MIVLKIDTPPTFEIVPRRNLDVNKNYSAVIEDEFTHEMQVIPATIEKKTNENYNITLATFPTGEKLAYEIKDSDEVVSMGKMLIINPTQTIQDYEKNNQKYY